MCGCAKFVSWSVSCRELKMWVGKSLAFDQLAALYILLSFLTTWVQDSDTAVSTLYFLSYTFILFEKKYSRSYLRSRMKRRGERCIYIFSLGVFRWWLFLTACFISNTNELCSSGKKIVERCGFLGRRRWRESCYLAACNGGCDPLWSWLLVTSVGPAIGEQLPSHLDLFFFL